MYFPPINPVELDMKKADINLGKDYETPIGKVRIESIDMISGPNFERSQVALYLYDLNADATVPFALFETWLPDVPEHTFDEMKKALIDLKGYCGDRSPACAIVNNVAGVRSMVDVPLNKIDAVYDAAVAELKLRKLQSRVDAELKELMSTPAFGYFIYPTGFAGAKHLTAVGCERTLEAIEAARKRQVAFGKKDSVTVVLNVDASGVAETIAEHRRTIDAAIAEAHRRAFSESNTALILTVRTDGSYDHTTFPQNGDTPPLAVANALRDLIMVFSK